MPETLRERIASRRLTIGVVGCGYVGLPLVQAFAGQGIRAIGFDVDAEKVRLLKAGQSYIAHIPAARVRELFVEKGLADATTDYRRIAECDAVLICVPTPLNKYREPDLSYVEGTARQIGPYVRREQLISLESTTYPGTTEEIIVPVIEQLSGLKAGSDFYVAFSPEREDPNNKNFSTATIPKVVGGLNPVSLEMALGIYNLIIQKTIPVSSCRVAEATKLLENIFRCVNIALVNELKIVFSEMGIDVHEVINAAKTKPFGYMPFYPGPGLGGHCIPIDPFYLTWKAREYRQSTRFIELAGEINTGMPVYVVTKTAEAMNEHGMCLKNHRILLVGLAYKSNVDDVRESPTFVLWEELQRRGALVDYYDPHCPTVHHMREHPQYAGNRSRTLAEIAAAPYDAMIIVTAHDAVDHRALAQHAKLVVDTRNVLPKGGHIYQA
jgi:UDP-N-acetyl-D-glucosamine dehydrogenase